MGPSKLSILSSFLCFLSGSIAWLGLFLTSMSPEWRRNAQGQTILDNIGLYDGLWKECKQVSTGQTKCQSYTLFFTGLSKSLVTSRLLALVSLGLGFTGLLLSMLGMKCIAVQIRDDQQRISTNKRRSTTIGGFLCVLSGGFGVACTMYFYSHINELGGSVVKSELLPIGATWRAGEDIYYNLAWAGLMLVSGFIICYSSCLWLDQHHQIKQNNIHSIYQNNSIPLPQPATDYNATPYPTQPPASMPVMAEPTGYLKTAAAPYPVIAGPAMMMDEANYAVDVTPEILNSPNENRAFEGDVVMPNGQTATYI